MSVPPPLEPPDQPPAVVPPWGFPQQEFAARAERMQAGMARADIDLLLCTTEPDVRYLSGFDTPFWHSPTRPWFLLLPAVGPPTAVIPEIGAPAMAATWVTDIRTWPAPVPADDGVTLLASTIRELAGPSGTVGVPMGPETHPLRAGDLLMLDTGAVHDGYFCDFDRNVAIGHAGAAAARAYDTLHRAVDAGLRATRPGVRCSELFAVMARVIEQDGYAAGNVGRFGHGLGLQLTEWPSHTPTDHTVLRPGMVITLEPGLTIAPGCTMVHEEDVLVVADGAELLSRRAPDELPVI